MSQFHLLNENPPEMAVMEPDISSGGNENRHNERAPRNGRDRRSAKRKIVIRALDGGKDNAARHNDDDRHRPRKIAAEPDGQPIAAKKEHHKDRRAPRAGNDLPDLNRPLAEPLAPMLGVDTRQRSQRNDDRREDVIQKVRDRQGSGKIGDRTLGKFLPNTEMGLSPDTYSFDIEINDTDYEFQFNVEEGDTNRDMQEKLSRLINRSNIGVIASVENDGDERSALRLESNSTGEQPDGRNLFTVSDENTSKTAGAVDYFGLSEVTSPSANAVFRLNGTEHSAYSNSFTIDKAYEVTLRGVTDEDSPVTVGLKPDVESLIGNISGLVRGYNDFVRKAAEYTEAYGKSTKFNTEMRSLQNTYRNELDAVGLSFNEDGTMDVDRKLLAYSANEGDPHDTLKAVTAFTNSLVNKASQISLNPMEYTHRVVVEYKNPGKNFPNPYITSMYSGMMFNGYC